MQELKLEKGQTGIAGEFYAAGELSRLGYNVTVTFGNTKAIDLLIQKEREVYKVQVKAIQRTKSICWNLDKRKITDDVYYVLVNLHIDKPKEKPEFFIITGKEARTLFTDTKKQGEKRAYLDYNKIKSFGEKYKDRWDIFGKPEEIDDDIIALKGVIRSVGKYANGSERFEIPLKETGRFPIVHNKRLNYSWSLANKSLIISIRFTKDAGGWICPDVYDFDNPEEKFALSELLLNNGFKKNEPVMILVDFEKKELDIKKIS